MTDVPELLRALVRRRGNAPDVNPLETEIRSQGAPNFKAEGDAALLAEIPTQAAWEWTYGVPVTGIKQFIDFLQVAEQEIINHMKRIINVQPNVESRQIYYRGTFISASSERGWYECRTVWAYLGNDPIEQWTALLADRAFRNLFVQLRSRWANDPTAVERLVSLLQLYTFPDDFVDPDHEAAQSAILEATKDAAAMALNP